MRKTVKFLISIILVLSIASAISLPCFAVKCDTTPVIVISGMASLPLYDENGDKIFSPPAQAIVLAVVKILLPTVKLILTGNYEKFADEAIPSLTELFEPAACNADGTSKYKTQVSQFPKPYENYTEELSIKNVNEFAILRASYDKFGDGHVYYFNYDFRLDPIEHAKNLNKFITDVKKQTGHDKVALVPCSMGGNVAMSYLKLYGSKDIKSLTMASTAYQGTAAVGEIYRNQIVIKEESLKLKIESFGKSGISKYVYPLITWILEFAGLFDLAMPIVDKFIENLDERIMDDLLVETFGYMPGMWALVADKDFEAAKATVLDKNTNKELIKKINYYHNSVQTKAKDIIKTAISNGMLFYNISQYGMQGLPLTPSGDNQNDFLIDTVYSSGGATCSKLNGDLGNNYKQQKAVCGHNHVSADNAIDASTSMFPEYTWFIRDMGHIDFPYGSEAASFIVWLISSDKQYSIRTNSDYPQFMTYNYDKYTLLPVTGKKPPLISLF